MHIGPTFLTDFMAGALFTSFQYQNDYRVLQTRTLLYELLNLGFRQGLGRHQVLHCGSAVDHRWEPGRESFD